jgi:2-iminobutanoate/2-iminopropanoate deaminase
MAKEVVKTDRAPRPSGAYSQAIRAGDFLFIAGQGAADPQTGKLVPGGIREQTRQALENVKAIVEAAGGSMRDIVKVTVVLDRIEDFDDMNEVYQTFFPESPPARATFQGRIGNGLLIEIDAIAYIPRRG